MKKRAAGFLTLAMVIVFAAGCAAKTDSNSDSSVSSTKETQVNENKTNTEQTTQKNDEKKEDESSIKEEVMITINGENYEFPMTYDDFTSRGWTYYDPSVGDPVTWKNAGLNAGYSGGGMYYDNGEIKALGIIFKNFTDVPQGYGNCEVVGLRVDFRQNIIGTKTGYMTVPSGSIQINGQGIGEASYEEMVEALGDDWNRKRDPEGKYSSADGLLYFFNSTEEDADCLTLSFDENDIFSGMSYTRTQK